MARETQNTSNWERQPVTVSHVVDYNNRYPGEIVTFFTCVGVHWARTDLTLRIALPEGLELEDYRPPEALADAVPYVEVSDNTRYLMWSLPGRIPAGSSYEYQTQARIAPTVRDVALTSRATVSRIADLLAEESTTVAVRAKGRYLRYLPELYARDELMGRFLMLFESYWGPIETQIDNINRYFNPEMTPPDFVPWLASWFDLTLNERLPEARRRQLIKSAVGLYRRRGTRQGLKQYLEIYTGGEAHIVEHRAANLRLGAAARMGHGIALGRNNRPHTFTVILRVPSPPGDGSDAPDFTTPAWEASLRALIETEKPAHTAYSLRVERLG